MSVDTLGKLSDLGFAVKELSANDDEITYYSYNISAKYAESKEN